MEITSITGGIPTKRVLVKGITTETEDEVLRFAMSAARETPSSLFGWRLGEIRWGECLVQLYTD